MSTVKSYPHYEVNVKDNSIYNFAIDETLPVHRAVWVLPTQKGPVGQPIWVRNKAQFDRIFGKQTLELYTHKYQSPVSFWLRQLLSMNGQFIVRTLPKDTATRASVVLWARVQRVTGGILKYAKNSYNGIENVATVQDDITVRATKYTCDFDSLETFADYGKYAIEVAGVEQKRITIYRDKATKEIVYNCIATKSGDTWIGKYHTGTKMESGEITKPADDVLNQYEAITKYFNKVTPADPEDCLKITFFTKEADASVLDNIEDAVLDPENLPASLQPVAVGSDTVEYPILLVAANYLGEYGNDYAFRFFANQNDNNAENIGWFKSVFNSFGAYRREFDSTTTTAIQDSYNRNFVNFTADPDAIDRETAVAKGMEAVLENSYDSNSEDTEEFPFIIYSFEENLKKIGQEIIEIENRDMDALGISNMNYNSFGDFVRDFGGQYDDENDVYGVDVAGNPIAGNIGYAINVIGGLNPNGNPYPHVKYDNGESYATGDFYVVTDEELADQIVNMQYLVSAPEEIVNNADPNIFVVKLDKNTDIFLTGGGDGVGIWDSKGNCDRSFLDKSMYDFVTLKLNNTIVDKFRYPFTHIYDIGYSMTTKFAMLDFLDIRDDVGVELSTQVLLSSEWATGFARSVKLNDMYEDITNGIVLRERAMMMRESILFNTDTMRASIFTQVGRPVDVNFVAASGVNTGFAVSDPVPFTFWSAYQHALYENQPFMSIQEPRGLPYSYNNLFKDWKWVPHYESQKERTWNTGLNYCQHADMSRIFYPALRTVYRHDTSILSDQWDVDALIYTKHECRKAWAHFVGRNDRRADLQAAIKKYLEEKLAYLYSGKFDFEVTVYQTEEEQKIGYIQHVKLKITFPATLRVLIFDIEVNREGYNPEA